MDFLTLKHVCGHEETHRVLGGKAERDRLAFLLAGKACTKCRDRAWVRRLEKATAWAAKEAMPTLTGTPRQVAMAQVARFETLTHAALQCADRRATVILRGDDDERAKLPAEIRRFLSHPTSASALREIAAYTLSLIEDLRMETSAAWWESHRRNSAWLEVEARISKRTLALRALLRQAA